MNMDMDAATPEGAMNMDTGTATPEGAINMDMENGGMVMIQP